MSSADLIARLRRLTSTSLIDAAPTLRVLPLAIRPIVPGRVAVGRVVTARANRDLMSVIEGLRSAGAGEVLVVDAGDHERAVAGELFATEALRRGLAALVVHGRVRDTATLARLDLPVFASGVAPNAYAAIARPEVGVELSLDGIVVRPGDVLVGDDDGLIVGSEEQFAGAIDAAEAIQTREEGLQWAIAGGASLLAATNYDAHVAAVRAGSPSTLAFS